MSYFIFSKNFNNVEGIIYRIAENQSDFNNLNIDASFYKVIESSQENFESVKYGLKYVSKYIDDSIYFLDQSVVFKNKEELFDYVDNVKKQIKQFTDNNLNHSLYNRWNDYYNQLNNLNLDSITYPLNKSLEQYFSDLGQISLNPLQIP
jgi:hypothetical protein